MKLKWKMSAIPTGKYRCFEKRGWPYASYPDGSPAASIYCEDAYVPSNVREGKHGPLTVHVADYRTDPKTQGRFRWLKLKKQVPTLDEAMAMALGVIEAHPEIHPKVPETK